MFEYKNLFLFFFSSVQLIVGRLKISCLYVVICYFVFSGVTNEDENL